MSHIVAALFDDFIFDAGAYDTAGFNRCLFDYATFDSAVFDVCLPDVGTWRPAPIAPRRRLPIEDDEALLLAVIH